jgi:hypothetical protein
MGGGGGSNLWNLKIHLQENKIFIINHENPFILENDPF